MSKDAQNISDTGLVTKGNNPNNTHTHSDGKQIIILQCPNCGEEVEKIIKCPFCGEPMRVVSVTDVDEDDVDIANKIEEVVADVADIEDEEIQDNTQKWDNDDISNIDTL